MSHILFALLIATPESAAHTASATVTASALERGLRAFEEFRSEDAIAAFEAAKSEGPYRLEDHVALYEQLGTAYAYLGRRDQALAAFSTLLALAPGYFLPYTISPKAAFIFEEARRASDARGAAVLELSWPRDLLVSEPVPLTFERVSDPLGLTHTLVLRDRLVGTEPWRERRIAAPTLGQHVETELHGPLVRTSSAAVEFFVTALDARGNEVQRVGSLSTPRRVFLRYEAPTAWYERWWVWAIAGAVVAGGVTSYAVLSRPAPESVQTSFSF